MSGLSSINLTPWRAKRPLVSVVRLTGIIAQSGLLRSGLNGHGLRGLLERAFAPKDLSAVALVINSPGGSPVQSSLIFQHVRALADEHQVPVLAFAEDVAASGGYWLACAADEIFADANSIIGSIGVVSAGFGFADAIARLGIERRLYTSGERKALLDSFSPAKDEDVERLRSLQGEIHESFKTLVRQRRGRRLAGDEGLLFSGEFWTGRRALELGLIDGIGELRQTLRARFGKDVRIRTISRKGGFLSRRLRGGSSTGGMEWGGLGDLPGRLLAVLEERDLWSRFGL
jgi:signal peptide peptidase SppA